MNAHMCVCGHHFRHHGHTGWPRYAKRCDHRTCCDIPGRSYPGGPDRHDFVSHPSEWCQCTGYTEQPTTTNQEGQ